MKRGSAAIGRAIPALAAALLLPGAAGAVSPLAGDAVTTPSGLTVTFLDELLEDQPDGAIWLTLRFLAPQIGADRGELGYEAVAGDIDALCADPGLGVAETVGGVDEVIIILVDRPIERGVKDPEATMYIGTYFPTEGGCVWE